MLRLLFNYSILFSSFINSLNIPVHSKEIVSIAIATYELLWIQLFVFSSVLILVSVLIPTSWARNVQLSLVFILYFWIQLSSTHIMWMSWNTINIGFLNWKYLVKATRDNINLAKIFSLPVRHDHTILNLMFLHYLIQWKNSSTASKRFPNFLIDCI